MNLKTTLAIALAIPVLFSSCVGGKAAKTSVVDIVKEQIDRQISVIEADTSQVLNPVTLKKDGTVKYCNFHDWRSGFFPGTVWYLYALTGDEKYLPLAEKYTEAITEAQFITDHHDIGFIVGCSFGNGLRLAGKETYKPVIVQAARSLATRFREVPGILQSWQARPGKDWTCPVIIDNMMNLELMFDATRFSGDSTFYKMAVSHADRTLQEHFRPNGSCYHVVDYDVKTGEVRHRQTAQGHADESSWSRGQAWAIYGYTVAYRETGQQKYLDRALATFEFIKHNPNMPEDCVPYWDYDAPDIPDAPRDASAAAIVASALYEICEYVEDPAGYKAYADKIMETLASDAFTARPGENQNFVLMHSVTSFPGNSEIDVPLNYADYYYLEALYRSRK